MIWDLTEEAKTIALVKALTDYATRHRPGVFLSDPLPVAARDGLYAAAGLSGWSSAQDLDAARRLGLWARFVREPPEMEWCGP